MPGTISRRREASCARLPNRRREIARSLKGRSATVKTLAHKMLPIFTMLGAAEVAETLRRGETCEGPLPEALCGELRAAAGKIRAIVAEAEKTLSL